MAPADQSFHRLGIKLCMHNIFSARLQDRCATLLERIRLRWT